jgi:ubiquinone/menaquinone biosynthesis C-methylase UbiE
MGAPELTPIHVTQQNPVPNLGEVLITNYEHRHAWLWFIFRYTIALLLSWVVERKTHRLIIPLLTKEERANWSSPSGRQEIMARARRNFGHNKFSTIFSIRTKWFNASSEVLQHFCRYVANAAALDDVYNVNGDFWMDGSLARPFSGEPDFWARIYLNCPNGQAVRNRYRIVSDLFERTNGGNFLSIACGSAQALLAASYKLLQSGKDVHLVLADPSKDSLHLSQQRALQAGIHNHVQLLEVPYKELGTKLEEQSFDAIEVCGILDYLTDKQATALLKMASGLLKPGGHIIVSNMVQTPEAGTLRRMYNWDITYRNPVDLRILLEHIGITHVTVVVEPWGIHAVAYGQKS